MTRQDPDDPNSPRIDPTPPYDFSSDPQQLNEIRRVEIELMTRSNKPLSKQSSTGSYPDNTAATYDQSGTPHTEVTYQDNYYHYTYRMSVSPRNLIESPWGRLVLHADPNAVPCYGNSSIIEATLIDRNGDSLANVDKAVVSVDGLVETISEGEVTITATDTYGCQRNLALNIDDSSSAPLFYDDFHHTDYWDIVCGQWNLELGQQMRALGSSQNAIATIKDSLWNSSWTDYIVVVKLKENSHSAGLDDLDGALLVRYQAQDRNYKLEMDKDSSGLHLERWNGGETQLGAAYSFSYDTASWYYQKIKVQGNEISVKVWKASDPEPENYLFTRTDSTFTSGKVGLRVFSSDVSFDSLAVYPVN